MGEVPEASDDVMKVVVIASYVEEIIFDLPRLMLPGETLAGRFREGRGGKGFNMTIAARRCGADVVPVMKIGGDGFSAKALAALRAEGICESRVSTSPDRPSGIGVILVGADGGNTIAIDPGANDLLNPHDIISAAEDIAAADVVLAQLEVPFQPVIEAFRLARASGALTILNPAPAPAVPIPGELLALTDLITPNESEATAITGTGPADDWELAAKFLHAAGPRSVVVTLGARGAGLLMDGACSLIPAPSVAAVDTSGAGDAFNGALAARLAAGDPLKDACRFAVRYAALQVTRPGTSRAMPLAS
jgi:ribokinase